ncbi:hypothetical protein V7198_14815, partial [Bacillus pumilus]|uniref:hypothetical protein n=1 Tax=Bacillus pumilus TaxID=1408 RepID=UPI002FFF0A9B
QYTHKYIIFNLPYFLTQAPEYKKEQLPSQKLPLYSNLQDHLRCPIYLFHPFDPKNTEKQSGG